MAIAVRKQFVFSKCSAFASFNKNPILLFHTVITLFCLSRTDYCVTVPAICHIQQVRMVNLQGADDGVGRCN